MRTILRRNPLKVEKIFKKHSKMQESFQKIKQKFTKASIRKKDESLKSWLQIVEQKQEFYCSTLGTRTWEEYKGNEREFLKLKLGFAIFGPSSSLDDNNDILFEEPIQNTIIQNITDVIEKASKSENIYLAFIYVIGNVNGEYAEFPIIRILTENDGYIHHTSFFVDVLGRLYKNWEEFLKENIFPECLYCSPKKGFYSRDKDGKVQLEYGYSPACKKLKRFAKGVDNLSDAALVGSLAIGLTSLAVPISTPVLVGAAAAGITSGIWSSGRSTNNLVDRKIHGQSISLLNQDARLEWLNLVSGLLGAAGAGAMHYSQLIARSGQVLSKVPTLVVNTLKTGSSISVGSLYIINQIMTMIEKKELSSVDSAQLALSILFYFHTKIDTKSIANMLVKLQRDMMVDLRKQLNSQQYTVIECILSESRKQVNNGENETVKSLEIIDSFNNLEDIFRPNKNKSSNDSKLSFSVSSYDDDDWVIVCYTNPT